MSASERAHVVHMVHVAKMIKTLSFSMLLS